MIRNERRYSAVALNRFAEVNAGIEARRRQAVGDDGFIARRLCPDLDAGTRCADAVIAAQEPVATALDDTAGWCAIGTGHHGRGAGLRWRGALVTVITTAWGSGAGGAGAWSAGAGVPRARRAAGFPVAGDDPARATIVRAARYVANVDHRCRLSEATAAAAVTGAR